MEKIFTSLNEDNQAPVEVSDKKKDRKQKAAQKVALMKESLIETVMADPTFKDKLRSLSDSLEVVNTLGFGDTGNIIVDKTREVDNKKGEKVNPLIPTSQIVGYKVRNIGAEPIKYRTEIWALGEDGKYAASNTEKTLAPGETTELSRKYMTALSSGVEFSFQLANGKVLKGAGITEKGDVKAELESYYFKFDKDENGEQKQVNDDEVKLNVGEKVGNKWIVRDEFIETFGYLNNPKETAKGHTRGKSAGTQFTAQDIAAHYINKLIEESGL